MSKDFVVHATFVDAPKMGELRVQEDCYLYIENGRVLEVTHVAPKLEDSWELLDFGDRLVIPGMVDLHLHASQYALCGTCMDLELLDWLETYTFPEERRFEDPAYADALYSRFVSDLTHSPTTRASIFATIHADSTLRLMKLLEGSALKTYVGKVNMDQNAPSYLLESTAQSLQNTRELLEEANACFTSTKLSVTPRFAPACTEDLMRGLAHLAHEFEAPVQSHVSENQSEVAWVKELFSGSQTYAGVYDMCGLFDGPRPCVLAHAVYPVPEEIEQFVQKGVYIAHCPQSNMNVASGIAPIRELVDAGVHVGLGTDIAAGSTLSMFRAVTDAVQVSKLRAATAQDSDLAISFADAFYLATAGGGSYFEEVGTFEPGSAFDALVLEPLGEPKGQPAPPKIALERQFYLASEAPLFAKFVQGKRVI